MKVESRHQWMARQASDCDGAYRSVGASYHPGYERMLERLEPVIQRILDVRVMRYQHPTVAFDDTALLLGLVAGALDESVTL